MRQQTLMEALDEDRAPAPKYAASPHEMRAAKSAGREAFLAASGYVIVGDGEEKVLKVNRQWIAGGGEGQWLLFIGGAKVGIKSGEVIFLDETTTEIEVVLVSEQREVSYGCGTRVETTQKEVRSAYLITNGRAAYRVA